LYSEIAFISHTELKGSSGLSLLNEFIIFLLCRLEPAVINNILFNIPFVKLSMPLISAQHFSIMDN